MAGLGKHKWIWMVKYDPLHYGGKGFTSHHYGNPKVAISLRDLTVLMPSLKAKGFVQGDDVPTVDLRAAGIDKILGSGDFDQKVKLIVPEATEKALKKLSSYGSTVETDG